MTHTLELTRRISPFRAVPLASLLLFAGACESMEVLEPTSMAVAEASFLTTSSSFSISNLSARSGKAYRVVSGLVAGDAPYIDRSYTFMAPIPSAVQGVTYIRTANADKDAFPGSSSFLSFDISADAVVYVAHDDRLERPAWLTSGFRDTGLDLSNSGSSPKFSLFKRTFLRGRVTLGSNVTTASGMSMYSVLVQPIGSTATAPVLLPAYAGTAFGVWHLPPADYATTAYTGAYLGYGTGISASTPSGFIAQIAQAKAAGRRLMVNLVPRKSASTGGPDMTYYLNAVATWKAYAAQLLAYASSGTIIGVVLGDEPGCGSCWNGKVWTTTQMQQAAEAVKALVPGIPRGFRVDPAWLRARNAPALYSVLDFAWLQYEGPLHLPCPRAIATCIDNASAAATSTGLRLVMGMNTLDGGDGSSRIPGTYTNAASSTVNRWQLSATEIFKYGLPLVTDSRVCAVLSWRYGANATKAQLNSYMTDRQFADVLSFDTRMRAPIDSVAKIASKQPARSCAKG